MRGLANDNTADFELLIQAIVSRDFSGFCKLLTNDPNLAKGYIDTDGSNDRLVEELEHYLYGGDTALHAAATIYNAEMISTLLKYGADLNAKNRRGAQALHYACDGSPVNRNWNPDAQFLVVKILIEAGADPACVDKTGVAPLHRAVRQRCTGAVKSLLLNGADIRQHNGSGSTPLHLAVQNTGRGGSGATESITEQKAIIKLLLEKGASLQDKDSKGKTVRDSIQSKQIRNWI